MYGGFRQNGGTPKSSILVGFSTINYPFLGILIYGNPRDWSAADPRDGIRSSFFGLEIAWYILAVPAGGYVHL